MAGTDIAPPEFLRRMHSALCHRCLRGLPDSAVEAETARMMIVYYCLSALDLLGTLNEQVKEAERNECKAWIWTQQVLGETGAGFRAGPFLTGNVSQSRRDAAPEPPHIFMTYTALLSLAVLRDDFSNLDRRSIMTFVRNAQREDGSFSPTIDSKEADIRLVYAALAICDMLGDWSGIDREKAGEYVSSCRTYEGGYGQTPGNEASCGPTYCALATLVLVGNPLNEIARDETLRWLLERQIEGFQGRTEKVMDACYSFWGGASISLLGGAEFVDADSNAQFLHRCQFKLGGFAKEPGERSDPLHTYLSLAALAIYPPSWCANTEMSKTSWHLGQHDPLLNVRVETAEWIRTKIPGTR